MRKVPYIRGISKTATQEDTMTTTTITAQDLAAEMAETYDITTTAAREAVDTLLGQIWSIDGTDGDVDAISADDAETVRDQFAAEYGA